jgi:tripartite-type tricarboxylate transporter receptor subunit TctC
MMHTIRLAVLVVATMFCSAPQADAQAEYPNRTVRIIVPHPPGGSTDVLVRIVAEKLQGHWGQPVVVESVVGAAGQIATTQGAKAAPDGYTMTAIVGTTTTLLAHLKSNLPFDPMKDFEPISIFAESPILLVVHPKLGVKTVRELIEVLKASPGKYNYASTGYGASTHIAAEWFKADTKTDIVHVPFTGSSAALPPLLGGHIELMFDVMATMWPQVQQGTLVALGVGSPERISLAPEVPAIAETVPGFDVSAWIGLAFPAGTPAEIVKKASDAVVQVMKAPEVAERMKIVGAIPTARDNAQSAAFMKADYAKWQRVIKVTGISLDKK